MFAFVAHFFHFTESELTKMSFERIRFWFDCGFPLWKKMQNYKHGLELNEQ